MAIEYAALFMVYFAVLYGVFAYGVPTLLILTYRHLSAEGTRAAVRVDPALDPVAFHQRVSEQVNQVIAASWLPQDWLDGGCPAPNDQRPWLPLLGEPSYGHLAREDLGEGSAHYVLQVCIQRWYDRQGNTRERAIIPTLQLGPITVPSLPQENGRPLLRGSSVGIL